MLRFVVSLLLILSLAIESKAQDNNAYQAWQTARNQYLSLVDSCDLINARDILDLGTHPVSSLKEVEAEIYELFENTRQARGSCYNQAATFLTDMIAAGMIYLDSNPKDIKSQRQIELDQSLQAVLSHRRQISQQLLDSLEKDYREIIKETPKNKADNTYVIESEETRELVLQDMYVVLEAERRQIDLDESWLDSKATPEMEELARVKLLKTSHYISRALLVYESALTKPYIYPLSRLQSEFSYAISQFGEMFSFSPKLEGLDEDLAQTIANVADRALVMEFDIEGAVRDMRVGSFTENYEAWLSELYQDMSQLAVDIRNLYNQLPSVRLPQLPEEAKISARRAPINQDKAEKGSTPKFLESPDGDKIPYGEAPADMLSPKNTDM